MAESIERGPGIFLGPLVGNVNSSTGTSIGAMEGTDGPGLHYQGEGLPDVRYNPAPKDSLTLARFNAWFSNETYILVDAIPSASSATPADIAPAQTVASGTAMTFVTSNPSAASGGQCAHMLSPTIGTLASQGQTLVTPAIGLDMGYQFGTTTTGGSAATVTVTDSTQFYIGQWIMIGGAGNSGNTLPLITQVQTLASKTTITISPVALGAMTRAPISNMNAYTPTTGFFPPGLKGTAALPILQGGVTAFWHPPEMCSRTLAILGVTGGAGGSFKIAGYDVYGAAMNETITVSAGAATGYGLKAWKYITSITPQFTDASHNYSVGVADSVGFPMRSDLWETMTVFVGGSFLTSSTGWQQALQAQNGPSSATTADVRGSMNVGTRNNSGSGSSGGPLSGTVRVMVTLTPRVWQVLRHNPVDPTPLYGLAQF